MEKLFSPIKSRIIQFIDSKKIKKEFFFKQTGISPSNFKGAGAKSEIGGDKIVQILSIFPEINPDWLLTGQGGMLKAVQGSPLPAVYYEEKSRNRIPLYGDVVSIGGSNEVTACMEGKSSPSEWIDTGDWFTEATAAIRHYGDSMVEYPSGCILALKEVTNFQLIIWGRDYVIETDDYRITKRIQQGSNSDSIVAYSSNTETYSDGRLIHEPIEIPLDFIRKISLVLGYVVKNYSSGMVYAIKKAKVTP